MVEVSEGQIREACRLLFLLTDIKAEPTGALAVAAVLAQPARFENKSVCAVVSGGNVDPKVFCELMVAPREEL